MCMNIIDCIVIFLLVSGVGLIKVNPVMVRLAIFGKTGVGKSKTANSILDTNEFKAACSGSSVTKTCQCVTRKIQGKVITIVDTPGIFDTDCNVNMEMEIDKCFKLSSPGPEIISLVVRLGRYSEEDLAAVNKIRTYFGKEMDKHVIFIFTYFDDLKRDQTGQQEHASYIDTLPKEFQRYVKIVCKSRFILFDNTLTGLEAKKQTLELFSLIDLILNDNKWAVYTHSQYQQAQQDERRKMRQEKEKIKDREKKRTRREEELKMEKELEKIKYDFDAKITKEKEEKKYQLQIQKDRQRQIMLQTPVQYNRHADINTVDILSAAWNLTVAGIRLYNIFTGNRNSFYNIFR